MNNRRNLPIPGQQYGFRTLAAAQAAGDYEALKKLGRRITTVNLGSDPADGLAGLLDQLPA